MSMTKIRAALETALAAMQPAIDTVWENTDYTPVAGVPYQEVNLLTAPPDNPTFGDGFYRERGFLQVTLNYPVQAGPGAATARADAIRAAFPRGASLVYQGVTVIIEKTPEIGHGAVRVDRWRLPVKIRWYADINP